MAAGIGNESFSGDHIASRRQHDCESSRDCAAVTQPAEIVSAATASVHEALVPHEDGARARLPGAIWLMANQHHACLNKPRLAITSTTVNATD